MTVEHHSRVLADNALGDPHVRTLDVWLPPQYDSGVGRGRGRRFPVLFDLVGFTGSGRSHTNWRSFDENVPERAARLIHDKKLAPCIIVFPDCFTSLGGNQYINSPAIGRYADYLTRELVPFVDKEFRTLAAREHRGCFGKSSGGYGAIIHGMKYPGTWSAIADHSGDAYFDFIYYCDWPNTLNELAKHARPKRRPGAFDVHRAERGRNGHPADDGRDDGRIRRFLEQFWKKDKPTSAEVHCLMNLAMAASYDPDLSAPNGFRVPFNLITGELIESRWRRWQAHDPVNQVRRYKRALKSLRGIYIDCGWRDQYHIHYRMNASLPFLLRALR